MRKREFAVTLPAGHVRGALATYTVGSFIVNEPKAVCLTDAEARSLTNKGLKVELVEAPPIEREPEPAPETPSKSEEKE